MNVDIQGWARRRSVRAIAMTALVLGPVAAVPAIMATGASASVHPAVAVHAAAAQPAATCPPDDYFTNTPDPLTGDVQISVVNSACDGLPVTVAAYETPVGSYDATASFPETLYRAVTVNPTVATSPVTVHVDVPSCFTQLDIITGTDAPQTLTAPYFTPAKTLINAGTGGTTSCTTTTTTTPPPPSCTPPATGTPPSCTSTTTPPPPSCTPPATGTPPDCASTTTTTPVTSSTTATPTCTPPAGTATDCVLGSSTSTAPPTTTTATTTSTTVSPTKSNPVLPFSTSLPPVAPLNDALPSTGANLPVRTALLLALALLTGGAALILLAGRAPGRRH